MYDATVENVQPDRVLRYSLTRDGAALTYSDVLDLWQTDAEFRNYYTRLLAESPFPAFRWETPALRKSTTHQEFQFVLLNSPGFSTRKTDQKTYENYFTTDDTDGGIVSFINLGGDARLVVPSPRTDINVYGHLAAFVRHAPKLQLDAFWRVVGTSVKSEISDNPLWLSTAGGGVAWLHVRLDSRPKYYGYSPYTIE
jgi:hypothetical protein